MQIRRLSSVILVISFHLAREVWEIVSWIDEQINKNLQHVIPPMFTSKQTEPVNKGYHQTS